MSDDWNVSTLKQHYDQRFLDSDRAVTAALDAQGKAINAALEAATKAVDKAEGAVEKRFDSVNEFRSALNDQQRTLIPRSEFDAEVRTFREKIDGLTQTLDKADGTGRGFHLGWIILLGIIGAAGTITTAILMLRK